MKKWRSLALVVAVAILGGCQYIEIKDGRVPAQYLSAAKAYEGTYSGAMEGVPGKIQIAFEGDTPRLVYTGQNGNDIIGNGCNSTIGLLQGVVVNEDNGTYKVSGADWGFNPGTCGFIRGRQVEMAFKEKDGKTVANVRILERSETHYNCYWQPGYPGSPGYPGYPGGQVCNPVTVNYYRFGSFTKN